MSRRTDKDAGSGKANPLPPRRHAFEDPLAALPPVAQNLLLAAKQLIATQGFDALTLNAVSASSGENKAMISYYFGNKAGLVSAVLDSVIHDDYMGAELRMERVEQGQRTRQLVEEMRRMTGASEEFRVFFELLPHALREEALRRRIALLYRWYWAMKLEWLGADLPEALDDPDLLGLTQILSAVIDGLALQAAIDPEFDLANPFRILEQMLEPLLPLTHRGASAKDAGGAAAER